LAALFCGSSSRFRPFFLSPATAPAPLPTLSLHDALPICARQQLAVQLQPSLGHLALDTAPAGATIRIDGELRGEAPQRLELPAGLHEVVLTGAGGRVWRSEVAIIAGQTLDLGRVELARAPMPSRPVVADAGNAPTAADAASSTADAEAPPAPPAPPPAARIQSPLLGTLVLLPAGE